jgi:hypothetical protein
MSGETAENLEGLSFGHHAESPGQIRASKMLEADRQATIRRAVESTGRKYSSRTVQSLTFLCLVERLG